MRDQEGSDHQHHEGTKAEGETQAEAAADAHHHGGPGARMKGAAGGSIPPVAASQPASGPSASDRAYGTWHAPKKGQWTQNNKGHKSDPVNIYVHGALDQLLDAFRKGGWVVAAKYDNKDNVEYLGAGVGEEVKNHVVPKGVQHAVEHGVHDVSHGLFGLWDKATGRHDHAPKVADPLHEKVQSMPMSEQQFHGQKEVADLEMGNSSLLGGRHHFRIFNTFQKDAEGRHVWAIAASEDTGVVFDQNKPNNLFTTHVVDPDTDLESRLVLDTLAAAGDVESVEKLRVKFGKRKDGMTASHAWNIEEKPGHQGGHGK